MVRERIESGKGGQLTRTEAVVSGLGHVVALLNARSIPKESCQHFRPQSLPAICVHTYQRLFLGRSFRAEIHPLELHRLRLAAALIEDKVAQLCRVAQVLRDRIRRADVALELIPKGIPVVAQLAELVKVGKLVKHGGNGSLGALVEEGFDVAVAAGDHAGARLAQLILVRDGDGECDGRLGECEEEKQDREDVCPY